MLRNLERSRHIMQMIVSCVTRVESKLSIDLFCSYGEKGVGWVTIIYRYYFI